MVQLSPFHAYYPSHETLEQLKLNSTKASLFEIEASFDLNQAIQTEQLQKSKNTGFYIHQIKFSLQGIEHKRTHLFALCQTSPPNKILRHEQTLESVKSQLFKHLETTHNHLPPIFGLYSDHEDFVQGYFEVVQTESPLFEFTSAGVEHTIWQDTHPERQEKIQNWFQSRPLFIADGHHRYESMRNFQKSHSDLPLSAQYAPFYLSNIYDPGLLIFPYHRLLKIALPSTNILEDLAPYFEIKQVHRKELGKALAHVSNNHTGMGLEDKEGTYLLTRPKGLPPQIKTKQNSPSYRQSDIAVLHEIILKKVLNFKTEWNRDPEYIEFSERISQIQSWLDQSIGSLGIYLNPLGIQELCGVAMAQETLPPKSTYFYPKVPNGLLLSRFKDAF